MTKGAGNLAERAEALDEARFVGRAEERAWLAAARHDVGGPRILHVHGEGGVGKSALLRAAGRDAEADGHPVVRLDGRMMGPGLDDVEPAVRAAARPGTVLLVDEVDALGSVRLVLRDALLRLLPDDALVVLAGRQPPGREWFEDGAEHLVADRRLGPLEPDDARRLLAHHGTTDPATVAALVEWADGYPLALTLGASTGPPAAGDGHDPDLGARVVAHLAGHQLDDVDPLVLEVAAIARAVDTRMLAAALPGRPTRDGLRQLRATTVTERVGPRIALHALVRRAVLSGTGVGPERRRDIVLRLADHLVDRIPDDPELVLDLAELVQDPAFRAVTLGVSPDLTADRVRPGDAEDALALWGGVGTAWGARLLHWCQAAPGHVVCIRDADGALVAIGVAGALDRVPEWAVDEPELGPALAHARAAGVAGDALFLHDMHVVHPMGTPAWDDARRVMIGAVAVRHGATRSHMYFTSDEPMADDCVAAYGFRDLPQLRRRDGERDLHTWVADVGPDGTVGAIRLAIRTEQGAPCPEAGPTAHRARALLDALRHFHDDARLATSPLANGAGADDARAAVHDAVERAFGPSPDDRDLRRALELMYLDPDGGPARAMAALHMSRSSFFRHLKRARERLAAAA